jgi:hypothetical protein
VDPLYAKYPYNSNYAFSENVVINAVELEGAEAKLIITTNIIGYTPQHVFGDIEKKIENNSMIVVPVYLAILKDANTDKVIGTYGFTRDAWYSRGVVDEGIIYDDIELTNRAFEPANGLKNLYTGKEISGYPIKGFTAYELTQNGSEQIRAEPFTNKMNTRVDGCPIDDARTDLGIAQGIMIHIAGWYDLGFYSKLAGSYGCFGNIPKNQIYAEESHAWSMIEYEAVDAHGESNESYMLLINDIKRTISNTKGEKKLLITVEKRDDVQRHKILENQ